MRKRCAYCGAKKAPTRDHVPPKCLFLRPLPGNMITVPSCKKCQGSSKDDEYFMVMTFMAAEADADDGFSEVLDGDRERLDRKWKHVYESTLGRGGRGRFFGLAQRIFDGTTLMPTFTPENLVLPHRPASVQHIERHRIARVAERIIRGLFFHEIGYRVPENYRVVTRAGQFNRIRQSRRAFNENLLTSTMTGHGVIQEGVFSYMYWVTGEDKNASAWLMFFHNAPLIFGTTQPKRAF